MDVFDSAQVEEQEQEKKPVRRKFFSIFITLVLASIVGIWFWVGQDPTRQELVGELYKDILQSIGQKTTTPLPSAIVPTDPEPTQSTVDLPQPPVQGDSNALVEIPSTFEDNTNVLPSSPNDDMANNNTLDALSLNNTEIPSETFSDITDLPIESTTIPNGEITQTPEISNELLLGAASDTASFVGRQEDSVIKESFVTALARWMVDMYQPATGTETSGRIMGSLQNANLRFGHSMDGIAFVGDDVAAGRKEALEYFYTSGMLKALYQLYNERFFRAIEDIAREKNLSAQQKTEMYTLYARRFRGLSAAFERMGTVSDLSDSLAFWHGAQRMTVESNKTYATAVFNLDEANEEQDSAKINIAQQEVGTTGKIYQQAIIDESTALSAFLDRMKENTAARFLSDGTLLYVALWVERRYEQSLTLEQADVVTAAVLESSSLFHSIAQKFEAAK